MKEMMGETDWNEEQRRDLEEWEHYTFECLRKVYAAIKHSGVTEEFKHLCFECGINYEEIVN